MSEKLLSWRRPPPPTATGPDRVTQAMLAEYRVLAALVRRHEWLRKRLLELVESSAPVEPGPLAVEIRRFRSRRLTPRSLAAVVGEANAQIFLNEIEPTESRRLDVREGAGASGVSPGGRRRRGRKAHPGEGLLPR